MIIDFYNTLWKQVELTPRITIIFGELISFEWLFWGISFEKKHGKMGMYDYLKIDKKWLPISEEEKKLIGNPEWQTKSFDCLLHKIEIMDDGSIRELKFDLVPSETEICPINGLPYLVKTNQRWEYIGEDMGKFVANFYDNTPNGWYEFNAYFFKGKLIEITGGKKNVNI